MLGLEQEGLLNQVAPEGDLADIVDTIDAVDPRARRPEPEPEVEVTPEATAESTSEAPAEEATASVGDAETPPEPVHNFTDIKDLPFGKKWHEPNLRKALEENNISEQDFLDAFNLGDGTIPVSQNTGKITNETIEAVKAFGEVAKENKAKPKAEPSKKSSKKKGAEEIKPNVELTPNMRAHANKMGVAPKSLLNEEFLHPENQQKLADAIAEGKQFKPGKRVINLEAEARSNKNDDVPKKLKDKLKQTLELIDPARSMSHEDWETNEEVVRVVMADLLDDPDISIDDGMSLFKEYLKSNKPGEFFSSRVSGKNIKKHMWDAFTQAVNIHEDLAMENGYTLSREELFDMAARDIGLNDPDKRDALWNRFQEIKAEDQKKVEARRKDQVRLGRVASHSRHYTPHPEDADSSDEAIEEMVKGVTRGGNLSQGDQLGLEIVGVWKNRMMLEEIRKKGNETFITESGLEVSTNLLQGEDYGLIQVRLPRARKAYDASGEEVSIPRNTWMLFDAKKWDGLYEGGKTPTAKAKVFTPFGMEKISQKYFFSSLDAARKQRRAFTHNLELEGSLHILDPIHHTAARSEELVASKNTAFSELNDLVQSSKVAKSADAQKISTKVAELSGEIDELHGKIRQKRVPVARIMDAHNEYARNITRLIHRARAMDKRTEFRLSKRGEDYQKKIRAENKKIQPAVRKLVDRINKKEAKKDELIGRYFGLVENDMKGNPEFVKLKRKVSQATERAKNSMVDGDFIGTTYKSIHTDKRYIPQKEVTESAIKDAEAHITAKAEGEGKSEFEYTTQNYPDTNRILAEDDARNSEQVITPEGQDATKFVSDQRRALALIKAGQKEAGLKILNNIKQKIGLKQQLAERNLPSEALLPPATFEGKRLIVRYKNSEEGKDDVRIMSKKQVEEGKSFFDLIGKKGNVNDWDFGYVADDVAGGSPEKRRIAWESATQHPESDKFASQQLAEADKVEASPINHEEVANRNDRPAPDAVYLDDMGDTQFVVDDAIKVEISDGLRITKDSAMANSAKYNGNPNVQAMFSRVAEDTDDMIANLSSANPSLRDLHRIRNRLFYSGYPDKVEDFQTLQKSIAKVYEVMHSKFPGGVRISKDIGQVDDAIEALKTAVMPYNDKEIAVAIKFLQGVKRATGRAPVVENTSPLGDESLYDTGRNVIGLNLDTQAEFVIKPRILDLIHEASHWGFANALSANDQLKVYKMQEKVLYDANGKLDKTKLARHNSTAPPSEISDTPSEGINVQKYIAEQQRIAGENQDTVSSDVSAHLGGMVKEEGVDIPGVTEELFLDTNIADNPGEFFAHQMEMLIARRDFPEILEDKGFWDRITHVFSDVLRWITGNNKDALFQPEFIRFYNKIYDPVAPQASRIIAKKSKSGDVSKTAEAPPPVDTPSSIPIARYKQLITNADGTEKRLTDDSMIEAAYRMDGIPQYVIDNRPNSPTFNKQVPNGASLYQQSLRNIVTAEEQVMDAMKIYENFVATHNKPGADPNTPTGISEMREAYDNLLRFMIAAVPYFGSTKGKSQKNLRILDPLTVRWFGRDNFEFFRGVRDHLLEIGMTPQQVDEFKKKITAKVENTNDQYLSQQDISAEGSFQITRDPEEIVAEFYMYMDTGEIPSRGITNFAIQSENKSIPGLLQAVKRSLAEATINYESTRTGEFGKQGRKHPERRPTVNKRNVDGRAVSAMTKEELSKAIKEGKDPDGKAQSELHKRARLVMPKKFVPIPRDIVQMRSPEIGQRLAQAIYDGDETTALQVSHEIARRNYNKKHKNDPDFKRVSESGTGGNPDNVKMLFRQGLSARKIDESEPYGLRNVVNHIRARTPDKEKSARTMAWRLIASTSDEYPDTINFNTGSVLNHIGRLLGAKEVNYSLVGRLGSIVRKLDKVAKEDIKDDKIIADAIADAGLLVYRSMDVDSKMSDAKFKEAFSKYISLEGMGNDLAFTKGTFNSELDKVRKTVSYMLNGEIANNHMKEKFFTVFENNNLVPTEVSAFNRALSEVRGQAEIEGLSPEIASNFVFEHWRNLPDDIKTKVSDFVGRNELLWDADNNSPFVFYHGSRTGALNNKSVVVDTSRHNPEGQGMFLSDNPGHSFQYGINYKTSPNEGVVLPVVVRANNIWNSDRMITKDEMMMTIDRLADIEHEYIKNRGIGEFLGKDKFRDSLLDELFQGFEMPDRISAGDFYMSANEVMRHPNPFKELGYDAATVTNRRYSTFEEIGLAPIYGKSMDGAVRTRTLIVYDSNNVKSLMADEFDPDVPELYASRVMPRAVDSSTNGSLVAALSEGADPKSKNLADGIATMAQQGGADPTQAMAVSKMAQGKKLTPEEHKKVSYIAWLKSQSGRMDDMGAKSEAIKYNEFFFDVAQRFAGRYQPLREMIYNKGLLPDTHGGLMRYGRRVSQASDTLAIKQPKSHKKLVNALQMGRLSSEWANLSDKEKEIANAIQTAFREEYNILRQTGYVLGDRGADFFPQAYKSNKIRESQANMEEFSAMLKEYYQREKARLGEPYDEAKANDFVETAMIGILEESDDGIFIPSVSSRNPSADSLDHARVIELDKDPYMLKKMRKYLEDDLDSILVKYFQGTSRKIGYAQRWGVNSHASDDYMTVAVNGEEGIAKLLSNNKQIRQESGSPVEGRTITAENVFMPFQGREGEATEFAKKLIEANGRMGTPLVKQMLYDVAPRNPVNGQMNIAYKRRADAIAGAIGDYYKYTPDGKGGQVAEKLSGPDTEEQQFFDNAMRIAIGRPALNSGTRRFRKASRGIRTLNNISLLSYTTLTSLSDLVLPLIRTGDFKSWMTGIYRLAADPDHRELMRRIGIAQESLTNERMAHLFGAPINKWNNSFFSATGLTQWTDLMRTMAGMVGAEFFSSQQKVAFKNFDPSKSISQQNTKYKTAHRALMKYGLKEFLPHGERSNESLSSHRALEDDKQFRIALIKFANSTVFQPNSNETPISAQHPAGAIIWQLKSFPLMMSRMSGDVLKEARHGNLKPLIALATAGPAMGGVALSAKDIIQFRGGDDESSPDTRIRNIAKILGWDERYGKEDDFLGWYIEGMMLMGGLGLIGDIVHSAVEQSDNGLYGVNRMASLLLGPSYGLGADAITAVWGAGDALFGRTPRSNAKERAGARAVVGRLPFVGGNKAARETLIDAIAGEK